DQRRQPTCSLSTSTDRMVTKIGNRKISANASAIGNAVKATTAAMLPIALAAALTSHRPWRCASTTSGQRSSRPLMNGNAVRPSTAPKNTASYAGSEPRSDFTNASLSANAAKAKKPSNTPLNMVFRRGAGSAGGSRGYGVRRPPCQATSRPVPRYNSGFYASLPGASMAVSLNPLDLYDVRSLLTDEERMVQDTVGRFVDERVLPIIGDCFDQARFPKELIPEIAALGLLGATIPEEYGGAGMNGVSYGLICQELERGDSGLRSFASVQSSLCMYPIFAYGSEEQKKHYLPQMSAGEVIGCFGLTEPHGGSDP